MVAANSKSKFSYEDSRRRFLEENKKKFEELNLHNLARQANVGNPIPVKRAKPQTLEKHLVQLRRSSRVSNNAAPVFKEVFIERAVKPAKSYYLPRQKGLMNGECVSDEVRASALCKAKELESALGSDHPTMVKTMTQSYVDAGLPLPEKFCKKNLPKSSEIMILIDEDGCKYPALYVVQSPKLRGGWRAFVLAHDLVEGDTLVFQLIQPTTFKVYIVRVEKPEGS